MDVVRQPLTEHAPPCLPPHAIAAPGRLWRLPLCSPRCWRAAPLPASRRSLRRAAGWQLPVSGALLLLLHLPSGSAGRIIIMNDVFGVACAARRWLAACAWCRGRDAGGASQTGLCPHATPRRLQAAAGGAVRASPWPVLPAPTPTCRTRLRCTPALPAARHAAGRSRATRGAVLRCSLRPAAASPGLPWVLMAGGRHVSPESLAHAGRCGSMPAGAGAAALLLGS